MRQPLRWMGLAVAALTTGASPVAAATQTFSPTKDSQMRSNDGGDCANGQVAGLAVGVTCLKPPCFAVRSVMHFDLSAIPHGSQITNATLNLYVTSVQDPGGGSTTMQATRSLQPLWAEEALIWESYSCDADPTLSDEWCSHGGDFDAAQNMLSFSLATTGAHAVSGTELVALIDDAVARQGGQLHLLFKQDDESEDPWFLAQIGSRENTTASRRPSLDVTWVPGPPPETGWVTFRDETDTRLMAPPVGPEGFTCTGAGAIGWLECDPEEKDIAVADFNDDGHPDIIVVRKRPFSTPGKRADLLLLFDPEQRVFRDQSELLAGAEPSDARDVFAGDLDGDRRPDLAIAATFADPPHFLRNLGGRCEQWQGLERKQEWAPVRPGCAANDDQCHYDVPNIHFCAIGGGDVDGDGYTDLYLANYEAPQTGTRDALLINRIAQQGRFVLETASRLGDRAENRFGTSVELHDLDGDGKDEIIKICTRGCSPVPSWNPPWGGDGIYVLPNDGAGRFLGPFVSLPVLTPAPYMFTVGTTDPEGLPDLFYVVDDSQDFVYLANQPFQFANGARAVVSPRSEAQGGNAKVGDMDFSCSCDTCPSAESPDRSFALIRNDGNDAFVDPWQAADNQNFHEPRVHDFAFIDINGNGCLDVFLALCGAYRVFINTTPGCAGGGS